MDPQPGDREARKQLERKLTLEEISVALDAIDREYEQLHGRPLHNDAREVDRQEAG